MTLAHNVVIGLTFVDEFTVEDTSLQVWIVNLSLCGRSFLSFVLQVVVCLLDSGWSECSLDYLPVVGFSAELLKLGLRLG